MAESKSKSEKPQEPKQAAKEAAAEADPADESPEIPVERMIAEAPAFVGEPSHVVAGALHGYGKKNVTIEETKAAVKAWLKAPVKEA